MKPARQIVVILVALGIGPTDVATSQTIGYSIASDLLMQLDLETGNFTPIGSVGAIGFGGLTMAADGTLFGVSYFSDDLWRIDPTTANSTLIGPLSVAIDVDTALAFDACGTLWMFTNRTLYEVDPGTGDATFIRDFGEEIRGLTAKGEDLFALVAQNGTRLARIDPRAGTLTLFGEPVFLPTFQQGLDFDSQGRLWGIFWLDGPIPGPGVSSIVRYDPLSGQVLSTLEVPLAQVQPVFEGNFAISPPQGICATLAIPVSSPPGLFALTMVLAAAALLLIRRLI